MYFLDYRALARDLNDNKVSNVDAFTYFIIFLIIQYLNTVVSNNLYDYLSGFLEILVVLFYI